MISNFGFLTCDILPASVNSKYWISLFQNPLPRFFYFRVSLIHYPAFLHVFDFLIFFQCLPELRVLRNWNTFFQFNSAIFHFQTAPISITCLSRPLQFPNVVFLFFKVLPTWVLSNFEFSHIIFCLPLRYQVLGYISFIIPPLRDFHFADVFLSILCLPSQFPVPDFPL